MQSLHPRLPCAVLVAALLFACSDNTDAPLVASEIVIAEAPPGRTMNVGYLKLTNNTNNDIRISEVDSPQFGYVEIHESSLEDDVARMRRLDALSIPARSSISLQPGGKHLMLMRPIGSPEKISLHFYDNETLLLSVQTPVIRRSN